MELESIDLTALSERRSARVEWKEGVADPQDVVRTLTAFANDLSNLGGGYVVCGARELTDEHGFQRLEAVGLGAGQLREIESRVLAGCRERVSPPIVPITSELPTADPARRVLVFTVAATGLAHTWRGSDQGGRHYVRIGRETREARNGLLLELLRRRGQRPPWDRSHPPEATVAEVDLLALRDTLLRTDRAADVSVRHEIGGTVLQQAQRLIELALAEAWLTMDKGDVQHPNVRRYPERALREAIVNAVVHRDYEEAHPVRVTAFADRIEIYSPGTLDRAVPSDAFAQGNARPVWRNQSLAWFFNQLDLAQGEGQGISTMLRVMAANGNPPPEFEVTPGSVVCVLRAHGRAGEV